MNRTLTVWTAIFLAASLLIQPLVAQAGAKDDIDRKIAEIRKQEEQSAATQKNAEAQAQQLGLDKKQQVAISTQLQADIKTQGNKLNVLELKITDTSIKLKETGTNLESAEERVATRDKFLKARVQMLYKKGTVSYLDVLMKSTSFSDFINRFDSIKTLVGQDKKILTKNKQDRNEIADLKVNIEKSLVSVKDLYAEAETVRQSLKTKEKQVKVLIASLTEKQEAVENLSDEQEANLITLAKQKQKLYSEKNDILAKEKRAQEAEARRLAALKAQNSHYATPANAGNGNGQLLWPVPASSTISSTFGYRVDPIAGYKKLHKGMDIAAPRGTNILAAESGTVLIASWVSGYGNCVVIDHGDGMWTWYGHIMEGGIYVSEGDSVKRGQVIAGVGSTGDSTGNHLHFEVRINEQPVNPMPYVQ
ncbi:MAG: peptidoglycan DD-metalloendopeptidase family protein [Gorillibacterium sp.]|nr:peptidoglycan DD-metalloendopeptidase family protein [Gorillibacterium sp.]